MKTMKKALSIFFLLFSLLAFKNIAYAQPEVDACFNFNIAEDCKRAIGIGQLAIKKYPYNADSFFAWDLLIMVLESLNLLMRT